ncbi:MAG: DUF3572 family protein [Sphingomicrobium sp.]
MNGRSPTDPIVLGLAALAATLEDSKRAQRLLDLTGIGTHDLRTRASEPALLAAVIAFLEAHEPDLLAVSAALGVSADRLVETRRALQDQGQV